jgi:hypothetical protein
MSEVFDRIRSIFEVNREAVTSRDALKVDADPSELEGGEEGVQKTSSSVRSSAFRQVCQSIQDFEKMDELTRILILADLNRLIDMKKKLKMRQEESGRTENIGLEQLLKSKSPSAMFFVVIPALMQKKMRYSNRYVAFIEKIVEFGVDCDPKDELGYTPLMYCFGYFVENESFSLLIVQTLIKLGAKSSRETPTLGFSTFDEALLKENEIGVKFLMEEAQFNPYSQGSLGCRAIYSAKYSPKIFESLNERDDSSFISHNCQICKNSSNRHCSSCLSIVYCSETCQLTDCKRHREECRVKAQSHVSVVLSSLESRFSLMKIQNHKSKQISFWENRTTFNRDILKVQLPISSPVFSPGPILCYTRNHSLSFCIPTTHVDYIRLKNAIESSKTSPHKAYFNCKFDLEEVNIYIEERAPWQDW